MPGDLFTTENDAAVWGDWTTGVNSGTGAATTLETTIKYSGTGSYKHVVGADVAAYAYAQKTLAVDQAEVWVTGYCNIPSGSTPKHYLIQVETAAGGRVYLGIPWTANKLRIDKTLNGWGDYSEAGTSFTLDVWHKLELRVLIHASAGVLEGWIDDVRVINVTGLALLSSNIRYIRAGVWNTVDAAAHTVYWDKVDIGTTQLSASTNRNALVSWAELQVPGSATEVFHSNSIWRRPIGANPTYLTQYDAFYDAWTLPRISIALHIPVYEFNAQTTARSNVLGTPDIWDSNPPTLSLPVPANAWAADPDTDKNLVLVDLANNLCLSMYRWTNNGDGTFTVVRGWYGDIGPLGNGLRSAWGPGSTENYTHWDTNRATKWGYLPGLVRLAEVQAGSVDHALVIGTSVEYTQATPNYVWPAFGTDGASTNPNHVKLGMRVQLDPNLDLDTLLWGGLPMTASAKIIAKALQTYGAWISDTAPNYHGVFLEGFYSAQGVRDNSSWTALGIDGNSLKHLPMPSFRIVQVTQSDFYTTQTRPPLPALDSRRGAVSWAELEAPATVPPQENRRGYVSWAELEAPIANKRGLVSWAELQIPDVVVIGDQPGGRVVYPPRLSPPGLTKPKPNKVSMDRVGVAS